MILIYQTKPKLSKSIETQNCNESFQKSSLTKNISNPLKDPL